MKPKGIGIVAEFTGIPTGLLLCALRPKERAQTRDKIMPTRAMRIPPDEMKRLGPTTCVLTRLMVRTCAPHALRGRNPLILSEEAAIRITDGTENPSPPGESVSLIGRNLTRARCECQIKKPASEKFPAIASPELPTKNTRHLDENSLRSRRFCRDVRSPSASLRAGFRLHLSRALRAPFTMRPTV